MSGVPVGCDKRSAVAPAPSRDMVRLRCACHTLRNYPTLTAPLLALSQTASWSYHEGAGLSHCFTDKAMLIANGEKTTVTDHCAGNGVFDRSATFQMACRQLESVADHVDLDAGVLERL